MNVNEIRSMLYAVLILLFGYNFYNYRKLKKESTRQLVVIRKYYYTLKCYEIALKNAIKMINKNNDLNEQTLHDQFIKSAANSLKPKKGDKDDQHK